MGLGFRVVIGGLHGLRRVLLEVSIEVYEGLLGFEAEFVCRCAFVRFCLLSAVGGLSVRASFEAL